MDKSRSKLEKAGRLFLWLATHRYLAFVFRVYIGGLFIYAAMYKINYSAEFAETIASYRMVPHWAVHFMAVVLPWIELVAGILLVAGIRVRSSALIILFLLVIFTIGIVINLARQSPISCGCFNTLGETISWWTFFRDVAWIGLTLHVIFFDRALRLENKYSFNFKEI